MGQLVTKNKVPVVERALSVFVPLNVMTQVKKELSRSIKSNGAT